MVIQWHKKAAHLRLDRKLEEENCNVFFEKYESQTEFS